jgi:hypothetical protein
MVASSGADLRALSVIDCGFMTDLAMAAIAESGLSLTALFVEEQCGYPGPDDTR